MIISDLRLPRPRRAALAASAFVACLAVDRAAAAAPPPELAARTDADPKVPFDEGRALMKAGRVAEAAKKFEDSLAIRVTPGAFLNLADCFEKLGRYASAVEMFERAQALSERAGETARADEAKARAAALRPIRSAVVVHSEALPELKVLVDGRPVATDQRIFVDQGDHVIVVSASCHQPFEKWVTVGLREDVKEIAARPVRSEEAACRSAPPSAVAAPATQPPPVAERPQATTPSSTSFTGPQKMALAVGAVGVVGLAVGAAFGIAAAGNKGDLDGACRDYPRGCPIDQRAVLDEKADAADRDALLSTVFIVTGAVLAGVGAVLYFTSPKHFVAAQSVLERPLRVTF